MPKPSLALSEPLPAPCTAQPIRSGKSFSNSTPATKVSLVRYVQQVMHLLALRSKKDRSSIYSGQLLMPSLRGGSRAALCAGCGWARRVKVGRAPEEGLPGPGGLPSDLTLIFGASLTLLIKNLSKVRDGNATLRQTCEVIRVCLAHGVPVMLENPISSMMWLAPPLAKLLQHQTCQCITLDQCQFGSRWRKRTRLATWGCGALPRLARLCQGRGGICSRTHKPHIVLSGTSSSGVLWTSLAQAYPTRLCTAVAASFIEASGNLQLQRLRSVGS
jgi:hypothetical protein